MNRLSLTDFVAWTQAHITGDEKSQAHILLDRLFQAFGQPGCLDVGGSPEVRIRKAAEDGGGTAFADYVWKPVVLIEMKRRGTDLQRHYRQAFDYWTRLVPNRPRYVVLCNFDEFRSEAQPGQGRLSFLSAQNFYGLDILPFAVEIAKVTMMVARKLAIDEAHVTEKALPLEALAEPLGTTWKSSLQLRKTGGSGSTPTGMRTTWKSSLQLRKTGGSGSTPTGMHRGSARVSLDNLDRNLVAVDALIMAGGVPTPWPKADVIIGNPPFLDARKMMIEHGREYVAALEREYPGVPRRADFCTYWLRKAHDHLPPCTAADPVAGRAGLVGTQNIRNNQSRVGGLDHIVRDGTIVEAVENQPWSGEANVHVLIVNWARTQDPALLPATRRLWFRAEPAKSAIRRRPGEGPAAKECHLDVRECAHINSALSDQTDVSEARVLVCNANPKVVFEGVQTGHVGFVVQAAEAKQLLAHGDAERTYVRPFLNGSDLLSGRSVTEPEFVVDLSDLNLLEASVFPRLLAVPRQRVLADLQRDAAEEREELGRDTGEHQNRIDTWWALKRPRSDMKTAIRKLPRYVACSAVMERPTFVFLSTQYLPTTALKVFAFPDDYSFGILQSGLHWLWFVTKCSKLTERFRYTPESVFDTFPWPQWRAAGDGVRRDALRRSLGAGERASAAGGPAGGGEALTTNQEGPAALDTPALSPAAIARIEAVAAAGCEVRRIRAEALPRIRGGLRALYRTLELPGKNPLKDAHAALDAAVLAAYGFDPEADLLAQLPALNLDVAARLAAGEPVTAPGLPAGFPEPQRLVTLDCIKPPAL
jgi:hypothetical protein